MINGGLVFEDSSHLPGGSLRDLGLIIYIDGASRGNPGPAGIGVSILDSKGEPLTEDSAYIGVATNNVAEYRAFLRALKKAREMGASRVQIMTDSELLCRQMKGLYRVRDAKLIPLFREAVHLTRGFEKVALRHIPRAKNGRADQLANLGIDAGSRG